MIASRGGTTPLIVKKILKKRQMQSIRFFTSVTKIFWETFKTTFETLSVLGGCHVTIIGGVVYKKSLISRFLKNISANFWYFIVKYFLVARSYCVLVMNIKILIKGALVSLETRLKVPILAFFDDSGHFSSSLFWHKPLA